MDYRSQVVLAISKHLTPLFTLKVTQNKAAESLVFSDTDTFDRYYGVDKSWLLTWDSIKWYASYEDVQALESFIEEACGDEYKFEVDEEAQASSEHIRFVRVGEESDDIEVSGDGYWDIYPSTSITY